MRTNEEILKEFDSFYSKTLDTGYEQAEGIGDTKEHEVNYQNFRGFVFSQRLQDIQAIKEMVEEVKKNYLTLGSKPTDIELGAEYALKGVSQKLDELMK